MIFQRVIQYAVSTISASLYILLASGCADKAQPEFVDVSVTVSVPVDIESEILRAFMYDSKSGALLGQFFMFEKTGNPDGTVTFSASEQLRSGTYDIVIYNFDIPDTFIRGEEHIKTLEAYTSEVNSGIRSRFGTGLDSYGTVAYTPDRLGVARILGAQVKNGAIISGKLVSVVSDTDLKLSAEGLEWSTSRSAVASGFAISSFLGTGIPGKEGSIWFEMQMEGTSNLAASVPTFGMSGDTFKFVFNVTTAGGAYNYSTSTDRSFEFDKSIVVPEPEHRNDDDEGGFSPQIGEWKNISVDVPVS